MYVVVLIVCLFVYFQGTISKLLCTEGGVYELDNKIK